MLSTSQVDAYYVWDVWGSRLEASGAKLVQRAVDVGFPSSSIWTMTREFLAGKPDVAARYVAALNQANIEMRNALAQGGTAAETVYTAINKANGVDRNAAAHLPKAQPPTTIAVEVGAIKQLPASAQGLIAPRSLLDAALKIKPTP